MKWFDDFCELMLQVAFIYCLLMGGFIAVVGMCQLYFVSLPFFFVLLFFFFCVGRGMVLTYKQLRKRPDEN